MGILTYKERQFYLDGEPFTVLSGAVHYFRVPREYWYDRLLKLKECGFNTVETYTCWNLHEPKEGEFDFSGNLDIAEYFKTAQELGLNIILRPGPYICSEWDFGGLPAWLLSYDKIDVRCYDELFLSKVRRYYKALLDVVRPYFASNGGNIFMLQIENEYGSYGDDKDYLREIVKIYEENNIDCLFFTSDGSHLIMQSGGELEGYLSVANFGGGAERGFQYLKDYRPHQPLMCGEFWCGWFDHWGEYHHARTSDDTGEMVQEFLDMDASFNFYMFHGGTNFNFWNGANYFDKYLATITSYDYGAPLSEAGDRTPTYYKIRELFEKKYGKVPELTAKESKKAAYGSLEMTEEAKFFENIDNISKPVKVAAPKYMEDIGQNFGYTLYRTTVNGPTYDEHPLWIKKVHDRAQVFVDGEHKGTICRWDMSKDGKTDITIPLEIGESASLDILVENMGRVNYGDKIMDHKGINGVSFGGFRAHFGWEMYPCDMSDLSGLVFNPVKDKTSDGPVFLKGTLNIDDEPCDTFIRLDGFTKGFVVVNGTNIGRYYNELGPQKTLYVPAPFLKKGANEIIVFESDKTTSMKVEFCDTPDLGEVGEIG